MSKCSLSKIMSNGGKSQFGNVTLRLKICFYCTDIYLDIPELSLCEMDLNRFVVVQQQSSNTNHNLQLWNNKLATLVLQLVQPQSNNNMTWCIRNGHCFHSTLQNFHTTITLSTLDQTSSCISVPPTWPIRTPMTTWRKSSEFMELWIYVYYFHLKNV